MGNELADGLGDGLGDGDADAVTDGDAAAVTDERAEGLVVAVGLTPLLAVPVMTALAVADPVTEGEKMAGVDEDEDAEQAEIATEANTVKAPQPAAVRLVLSTVPAMVVRTFMEPPCGPGRWRPCFRIRRQKRFRILAAETAGGRGKHAVAPEQARAARRRVCETPASHKGTADGRRRQAMACSASKY